MSEAVADAAAQIREIGAVDMMISFPTGDPRANYEFMRKQLRDAGSAEMEFPAEYMFTKVPNHLPEGADPVEVALAEMDHCGVAVGLIGSSDEVSRRALEEHPDRFKGQVHIDPNDITGAVRAIRSAHEQLGVVAVSSFPAGCSPQVPISDRRFYPVYQTCVDLGLPMILNSGIPGPRLPGACQDVMHFDQICYDFPELVVIMAHGAEPQEALAVKLMLKWPGLHYMTSAFAPKYYPSAVVDFANTRGSDKVMYAGYYPMGLSLRRIFDELPHVPFRAQVWPKFLRENAERVLGLNDRTAR